MSTGDDHDPYRARRVAEAVRRACIKAAQAGYEDAAISGLCGEGALQAALDAVRMLDLDELLGRLDAPE